MKLIFGILLAVTTVIKGEDASDNLPLCPINMQYFPQSLPMHCKMPFKAINNSFPQMAAPFYPQQQSPMQGMGSPQMYQSMNSGGASPQMAQMGSPGQAGGYPYPAMPQMPMMPMPGMPMLPQKPPMVVMPYYAPQQKSLNKKKKKQHKKSQKPYPVRFYDTFELPLPNDRDPADRMPKDTSAEMDLYDSLDIGDEFDFDLRRRKSNKRRNKNHQKQRFSKTKKGNLNLRRSDPLTPVLQYVSRDGYVIYEKELTQHEAHEYLTEKPTATTKRIIEERFAPVGRNTRREQESQSNEDTYDDNMYHDMEDKIRSPSSGKDRKNTEANGEEKGRNKKSNMKEHIYKRRMPKDPEGRAR